MEHTCRREGCDNPRPGGRGYCCSLCYQLAVEAGTQSVPPVPSFLSTSKPATDPGLYLTEGELACELFKCDACGARRGTGCYDGGEYVRKHDPHIGRVDKLRSLRAYCQGVT